MPRFENTPGLFGRGVGEATFKEIACDWCGTKYPDRAYPLSESISFTKFGDLTIVECCFEKVEEAVFSRIDDIIPWFVRILLSRRQTLEQREGMIAGLREVLGDL